ncbi:MAG: hypothetical protein OEY59_00430 [Deltaproteobacteria bacterium]|nr:hypothetical protein [Deltaproteobacteria bacterium]
MLRRISSIVILIFFFAQIAYLSYSIPQVVLLDLEFGDDIKLSLVLAGISIGVLYFIRDKTQRLSSEQILWENEDETDIKNPDEKD